MSYPASRWAQAHTLVIGRDPHALAALKELADAFIDKDGCCSIESLKELALSLGLSKPETASAAVSRLAKIGLVRASNIYSGRVIVGTRFELLGYKKDEWPAERKGKKVWVEVALSKGLSPMPWWPKFKDTRDAGDARGSDDIRQTGVPRETGEGTPRDGGLVPRETGEGYPAKRGSYKGIGKGMERDKERGMAAPDSAGVPEVSEGEKLSLDTNPNAELMDDVPFPDFEEPTSDELFVIVEATEPKAEAKPKAKRTRAMPKTRCPFDERKPVVPQDWLTEFEEDFPSLDVPAEFKKFVGFHVSKGNVFANWKTAFRNWLGKALSFQARDAARSGGASRPTSNFKRAFQREDMVYTDDF